MYSRPDIEEDRPPRLTFWGCISIESIIQKLYKSRNHQVYFQRSATITFFRSFHNHHPWYEPNQPGESNYACNFHGLLYWLKPNSLKESRPGGKVSIIDVMNTLLLTFSIPFFHSVHNKCPPYRPNRPGESKLCMLCPWAHFTG